MPSVDLPGTQVNILSGHNRDAIYIDPYVLTRIILFFFSPSLSVGSSQRASITEDRSAKSKFNTNRVERACYIYKR